MKKIQTDSYTIAHYVLLFLVIVVVVWFAIWAIRSTRGEAVAGDTKNAGAPSCVQQTIDSVAQMWINNSDKIPPEYTEMMNNHANRIVNVKTRGNCNGESFICEMGAVRSTCDPCAFAIARQMAIDKHTSDMVLKNCNVVLSSAK